MKQRKILILAIAGVFLITGATVGAFYLYFPNLRLPDKPVTMKVYDGAVSYFDIYLSDVPDGLDVTNGYYIGWCADRSVIMPRAENLTVRLYNSYDLLLPLTLRDKDWDKVNYILNHKGDATKTDIQEAFWHLLNDYPYDSITKTAQLLVDSAKNDYMPQPGDLIAILAEPIQTEKRPWPFQFAFLQVRLPPQEGLTPGYWKNHDNWPAPYEPSTHLNETFKNASIYMPSSDTMLDALKFKGGDGEVGAAEILLRAAVAAVLNARYPTINYPVLEADLIAEVNDALASHNRDTMLDLKDILDDYNNLGADISK